VEEVDRRSKVVGASTDPSELEDVHSYMRTGRQLAVSTSSAGHPVQDHPENASRLYRRVPLLGHLPLMAMRFQGSASPRRLHLVRA
jgi:hypothetical protein